MDAADRVVSEVRALREGVDTPEEYRDPQLNPFTLPLTSLLNLEDGAQARHGVVVERLDTANTLLAEVRDAIIAGGGDSEELLGQLQIITALLGAL